MTVYPSIETASKEPWPEGVTARLLTKFGRAYSLPGDARATTDVYDVTEDGVSTCSFYRCVCGTESLRETVRNRTVEQAQEHADGCTALPRPAGD